ncbi:hypothetical protein LWI28_022709 [Acer negundo]|uniref:DUF4283 domain-containing protein n=1 Tax=Acer negundo TaxID=4023 RepID=A0AAD5IAK2_ACENE|nr:hypothetical protein LWI28_022709 [Acer negundo]
MHRWSDTFTNHTRLAWVNCWGVPLSRWCETFFISLSRRIGEPLLVEDDYVRKYRMGKGCILVLLPAKKVGPYKLSVVIKGVIFMVRIDEDPKLIESNWINNYLGLRRRSPHSNLNFLPRKEGGKRNSGQKYPHKNGMVGEMGKSRQDNHAFAKYTTDQVDKILVDKGKGMWFKKARVKAVAIHDRSAKLDLDKRGRVAVEKVAAKTTLSTSFSSSNDSLIRWKGECSRRRESAGLQSPSLDQVLVAQPRLTSRSLSPAMDQLQVAHKCYSSMGLDNRVLKGSSEDRHSNNISQNTNFCPSEDDGFRHDRKDDFWTICEVSNGQVVVKQRNYDCVKNHIDQDFASVSAVPETNMREESLKDGEFDSDGLISDSNFGEDSLSNDFSMRDSHLLQDINVVDVMQEGMMFLLGDKKANDLG